MQYDVLNRIMMQPSQQQVPPPPPPGEIPFQDFIAAPAVERNYLAFLTALDLSSDQIVTLGYSGNGYTSHPTDSPASTYFDGRLRQPISFSRGIESTERLSGLMSISGEIEIENGDGDLDMLFEDYAVDGRELVIRSGLTADPLTNFGIVFAGHVAFSEALTERVVIGVSDGLVNLDKPIQESLYSGTAGSLTVRGDGGLDLKGQPKPLAFGHVDNVSPALIDPVNLVYQVHDGPIKDITAVYDRGVPLVNEQSFLATGTYFKELSAGTFILGGAPSGTITCDVQGAIKSNGTFPETNRAIVEFICTHYCHIPDAGLDFTNFTGNGAQARAGYWIDTTPTSRIKVLAEIIEGFCGYAGFNRLGKLEVGILKVPFFVSPIVAFTKENIISLERLSLPESLRPVVGKVSIGYGKNWTIQTDLAEGAATPPTGEEEITAASAIDRAAFTSQEYRFPTPSEDAGIQADHLLSQHLRVKSFMKDEVFAIAEQQRLLSLFNGTRSLYRISVSMDGIIVGFGSQVLITFPRYGLNNGKQGTIVGQGFDAARGECELTVFV